MTVPASAQARGVVKICGLTSAEAVAAAGEAGADRVGFVFAESPRRVSPAQAARLVRDLAPTIARVAVLRAASQAAVDGVLEHFPADWIQADAASLVGLQVPVGVRLMPVVRDGETPGAGDTLPAGATDAILYEAPVSGQGVLADWAAARRLARRHWLMLAGGLHPGNVAQAIRAVGPAGVDVSSGVESAPGVKDPALIRAFVAAARAAWRRVPDEALAGAAAEDGGGRAAPTAPPAGRADDSPRRRWRRDAQEQE